MDIEIVKELTIEQDIVKMFAEADRYREVTEGIFILLAILIFIYLYIWLNKNFQIKEIMIDEVATLPLREQQKLLDKERKKLVHLMYEYNNAGYWKGIIRKYYIPNIEKKIRIEKKIKVVETNISLLEKAINEMKV